MDTRKLDYFVEVVEHGSLTGAATRLGVSQAALSKAIRVLERELGVHLLDRGPAGIAPTVYGRSLYAHARTVATTLAHARVEIDDLRDRAHSHIAIGVLPDLGSDIIPRATERFCVDRPSVQLRIVQGLTDELIAGLRLGRFDFVIGLLTSSPEDEAGLRRQVLFNDSLSVIAAGRHPLAGRKQVGVDELKAWPWVLASFGETHRERIRQLFRGLGSEPPPPQIECGSVQFAKAVVRGGRHLAALPLHVLADEIAAGVLKALPVRSPALVRKVAALSREDRPLSAAGRALIAEIRRLGRQAAAG